MSAITSTHAISPSTTTDNTTNASSTGTSGTASSSSTPSTTLGAFPVASPSILPMASTAPEPSSSSQNDSASAGLPNGVRIAIYATTIIGGTFLIALLIWTIRRQRLRRRTIQRRRVQEELSATTRPRKRPPEFEGQDMTEAPGGPFRYGQPRQPVPSGLAERFRRKDAYIKASLGEAYPMHTDITPDDHFKLLPASPPRALTRIDEDMTIISRPNSAFSILDDGQVSPLPSQDAAVPPVHLRKPPDMQLENPRWSWTNSQAPATPRMYVPTIASSRNSAIGLRMALNWVKTRGERVTSGVVPQSSTKMILPKPGVLKNQASKPNLAPNKLIKKNSVRRPTDIYDVETTIAGAREAES